MAIFANPENDMPMHSYKIAGFVSLLLCCFQLACVPAKKFQDEQTRSEQYRNKLSDALAQSALLQKEKDSMQLQLQRMSGQAGNLRNDTAADGEQYRQMQMRYDNLNALYEKTVAQNEQLLSHASSEKYQLNNALSQKEQELAQREARVKELEGILSRKDSAVNALKKRITDALLGFDKSDLTVTNKNGKIYVSLAEKLLFRSGSTVVDPKGVDALHKLSSVLKKDPDIHVMVEGHTDDVPLHGTGAMKDNWDLSVLRATSITRILADDGVAPQQITAAGRSKFVPVAGNDTPEGRALNRRTEIILTPKLDELFKILETD